MQIQLSGRGVPETLRSTRTIGPARLPTRVEHTGWLAQAKKWEHPGESAGHQCQLQHHIPVALPRVVAGRSPDSRDLTRRLPRRAQWHCGAPALAYRCGGSRGLAPGTQGRTAFPFNCRRRNHPQHLRTSRIISAKFQRSSRDEPDHGSCKRCRSNGTFKPMELSDKF